MREQITITANKTIEIPARIYLKSTLEKMQVGYVNNKLFLNKAKFNEDFEPVSNDIKNNMGIINYPDCSAEIFSEKKLGTAVKKQLEAEGEFIILPYFKGESDHDTRIKIELAEKLKLSTEKMIILEISYKSTMHHDELANSASNFDFLSIFYGTSYGHYPSFEKVVERIYNFKARTGKKVFCFAVPLKFAGAVIEDVRFMPCFDIISDGWIKNWRRGGGAETIKVIDPKDFKSKTYEGWLASGYQPNSLLAQINRTVFELFRKDAKEIREEYEAYITDEILMEIHNITPANVLDYVGNKFHSKYFHLIILPYREKVIISQLRRANELERYSPDQRFMIERKIREFMSPLEIERAIVRIKAIINSELEIVPVQRIMEEIDRIRA